MTRSLLLILLAVLMVGIGGLSAVVDTVPPLVPNAILVLIGLGILIILGLRRKAPSQDDAFSQTRIDYAESLRATRERERAFYDLTNTLSSTLDYQKVLEVVQDIGKLITKHDGAGLISAAFLFQGSQGHLQVANARGLTRSDMKVEVPGKRGILGLALKQAEPVFGELPTHDPELQYFASFQDCHSILALPLRASFKYYGVQVFGSPLEDAFAKDSMVLLKAIGTQATIALQNAVLYQDILEEKERIVEVEEDARKKLARELHDGPTQSIAAIAMRINYIRRLVGDQNEQAFSELGKVEDLARKTTREIRHMLFTLRPLILETQGLLAALEQLSEKMRDTHNLNVLIEGQPNVEHLMDSHKQGVVFYIIEEAINNARKHAQSQHIWVRLYRQESDVMVEIEDDGVGFDQTSVEGNYEVRGSLGMVNMKERTELVEGTLHIDSQQGIGTKISVLVPAQERHVPPQPASPPPPAFPKDPNKPKPQIPHASKRSPSS